MFGKFRCSRSNCQSFLDHWVFSWGQLSVFFSNCVCATNFDPKLHWCPWNLWLERFVQLENILHCIEFCFVCLGLLCYQVYMYVKPELIRSKKLFLFMFFRNRAKKKSFTSLNLTFLLLKTMFDSISRILLFSTWLYVINDGQFSSTKTVIAYYSTFILLFIFNAILNKHRDYKSARNWIGRQHFFFWVLLHSLSVVYDKPWLTCIYKVKDPNWP